MRSTRAHLLGAFNCCFWRCPLQPLRGKAGVRRWLPRKRTLRCVLSWFQTSGYLLEVSKFDTIRPQSLWWACQGLMPSLKSRVVIRAYRNEWGTV